MKSFLPQRIQAQLQPLKDSNSNCDSDGFPDSSSVSPRKSKSKAKDKVTVNDKRESISQSSTSTSSRASLGKENVDQEDRNDQDLELVRIYKSSLLRDAAECKRIDTIQSFRDPSGRHFVPFQYLHHGQHHGQHQHQHQHSTSTSTRIQPRPLHRHTHDSSNLQVTNCNKIKARGNSFASTEASAFDAK